MLGPLLLAPLLWGSPASAEAAAPPGRPNLLVVVLDDVGTDMVGAYGDPDAPCTPSLDALAAGGVRLDRAYANPVCSPSRACLLTGRYGFRTGVGTAIAAGDPAAAQGLAAGTPSLPEWLAEGGYASAAIGKWHLAGAGEPPTHPNDLGFATYRGHLAQVGGSIGSYFRWDRTVDGVTALSRAYATTRQTADALEVLAGLPQPWLGFVSFSAAHGPYQAPDEEACASAAGCACPVTPSATQAQRYRAIVESADAHIGLLVRALWAATGGDLVVMVLGDNGTPRGLGAPCPRSGKGVVHEGGIRVPWIVYGKGVVPGVRSDLVQTTDLAATLCELADLPVPAEARDSLSFAPVLRGRPGPRRTVYAEFFSPNGLPFAPEQHRRAVLDQRWKLIRRFGHTSSLPAEELYDLAADPCETTDLLLAPLSAEARAAYLRLEDELDLLGVG